MDIYLLRHAIAVERGSAGYKDDRTRPLTSKGKQKMRQNALGMKALNLSFDVILSSPYLRATQTTEIVTKIFKIKNRKIVLTKNLVPDASFKDLIAELNAYRKKAPHILLVGHEPHLSEFISFLLTGKQTMSLNLKKGGLCHLSMEGICRATSATLNSFLTPSQLCLIHKK